MINASPRLGALLAGGAALVAFGLTGPAMADGANDPCPGHAYCGIEGTPSNNGNGVGPDKEAGSEGKADDKFPPGQSPDGSDHNNGYECDGNSGVGRGNPAHSRNCATPPPDDSGSGGSGTT